MRKVLEQRPEMVRPEAMHFLAIASESTKPNRVSCYDRLSRVLAGTVTTGH